MGLALLEGCQTTPSRVPLDPRESLQLAEELLAADDLDQATATLEHFGATPLDKEDQAHWYLLAGTALFRSGEAWDAYELIRDFIENNFIQRRIPDLAELTYRIGEELATSDYSVWIFHSDRRQGAAVLATFVSLYSNNPRMADALHRLGELAFEDGNYELARERYTQIGTYNSVWNAKANFRIAMCYFRNLEGPDYDLAEMNRAMNELRDFLAGPAENPLFRQEAAEAFSVVREWIAGKHLIIGEFYAEVENPQGARHHLQIAIQEFPETAAAAEAQRRLAALSRRESGGGR